MSPTDPRTQTPDYLANLNPAQLQAVETLDGPVLVLAGAGTGKTRVLTTRLAHLLYSGRAFPGQILAVTFTNKAANEMRERVARALGGQPVEGWWLGTFHALAARMLRRHADLVGLTPQFTILDDDDQQRLIKQLCEAENVDTKKWPPKLLLSMISRWKDRGLTPEQLGMNDVGGDVANGRLLRLYQMYQQRLRTLNACDFGDLLLHMLTIFRDPNNSEILADYHRKFRYVLVDEYQDTNVAQYLWLRLLAQGHQNICCVGDDDQSIYGWRGAEVGNILKFERDFPGAVVIRLEQNYRSTQTILAAASGVIANNQGRLGKTLWSEGDKGDAVMVRGLWDSDAEARAVSDDIETRMKRGESLQQMAVLVRAGFQMRSFEERFVHIGLPYRVIGGPRFYERLEIRDAMAYLRIVVQPADDLALERVINTPKRGIGDATIQHLHAHARANDMSLYNAMVALIGTDELRPAVRQTLTRLVQDFERWRSLLDTMTPPDLAGQVLDESGYTGMWQADKTPEAPGRLENLKELVGGLAEFESLPAFLEHVSLVMENQQATHADAVTIMTLHGAKGLEFDTVYLPGWEEGLFPSQRAMDETGVAGLEEERRLAYVGLTRARKSANISFVANRRTYGNWVQAIPSRFVDELPPDAVQVVSELRPAAAVTSTAYSSSYAQQGKQELAQPRWSKGSGGQQDQVDYYKGRSGDRFRPNPALLTSRTQNATPQNSTRPPSVRFRIGQRVSHDSFGEGTIVHMESQKLDIEFDNGLQKRVMASFITPLDSQ